jgi:hypothetical protein
VVLETLLGGVLGSVARLAPEVLSVLDKKNERKHELAMLAASIEADKLKAANALQQTQLDGDIKFNASAMTGLIESIKAQAAPSGVKWIDGLTASVRPVLTYWWCLVLYTAALTAQAWELKAAGLTYAATMVAVWGSEEKTIVASMLSFWFISRVIEKKK